MLPVLIAGHDCMASRDVVGCVCQHCPLTRRKRLFCSAWYKYPHERRSIGEANVQYKVDGVQEILSDIREWEGAAFYKATNSTTHPECLMKQNLRYLIQARLSTSRLLQSYGQARLWSDENHCLAAKRLLGKRPRWLETSKRHRSVCTELE